MSKFIDLLQNPFAQRTYLITVSPYAYITGSFTAVVGGSITGAAGSFTGLVVGDVLQTSGFVNAANNGTLTLTRVAKDGSSITGTGLTTVAETATAAIQGQVTRYYSDNGLVSTPTDTPANTWFNPLIETPLNFQRSMYSGNQIGGASIPGQGDIKLQNLDGSLDALRFWGWAARTITVQMGGVGFALSDYGTVFSGLVVAIDLDEQFMTLHVRDFQQYLSTSLWTTVFQGTGLGYEGPDTLLNSTRPFTIGKCRNIEPIQLGVVNGYWTYQFHDGQVGLYDSSFHRVLANGVPYTYVTGSTPGAGQWCLDDSAGVIIIGGGQPSVIRADVIGDNPQRILSSTSNTIGTGSLTWVTDQSYTFTVGQTVRVQRVGDKTAWMLGTVTSYTAGTGSLTVSVTSSNGSGTFTDWVVILKAAANDIASMVTQVATTRVQLQSGYSLSTAALGTGSVTITVSPASLPFGAGGYALIANRTNPTQLWMYGQVTAWNSSTGALTVLVSRALGSGSGNDWTVTKMGFLPSEIASSTIAAVTAAQPAPGAFYSKDGAVTAIDMFDKLVNSAALWWGFNRAGLFQMGQLVAPSGSPILSLDQSQVLDLKRQPSRAPVWSITGNYQMNWGPLQSNQLAGQIQNDQVSNGRFDTATIWSTGTGWTISGGVANAAAGTASDLSQTLSVDQGQTFYLTAQISVSAGTIQPKIGGVALGSPISTTTNFRMQFTAGSTTPALTFSKDASFVGTIDNVSVTVRDFLFFQEQWRQVLAYNGTIRAVYGQGAIAETIDMYLDQSTDAQTEINRQLTLLTLRDVFEVSAKTQPFVADIGSVVKLTDTRFGLSAGRLFIVLGLNEDASVNSVTLTLWG
jgi:hypothetical protein